MSSRSDSQMIVGRLLPVLIVAGLFFATLFIYVVYSQFRIDVPTKQIAILIKRTGKDITNSDECAPGPEYKGVQKTYLTEGRYFYNPYIWDWKVIPYQEIEQGELGVLVRLHGDNLPYREFVADKDVQKGIIKDVLRPGRYPVNPYLEKLIKYKPVTIEAGYRGIVTLLSAPMPSNPNSLIVEDGRRGVQKNTLEPGTYYINPYVTRINIIDCRSQRFNLSQDQDMGFPSKDGFWVNLDGIVEYRIKPEKAPEIFVTYNELKNDVNNERIDEEIVNKIILPNARSFCRLHGSNNKGRDFIGGDTRIHFQKEFQEAMAEACEPLGIEIVQALITKIYPPQAIATPVRDREVSRQTLKQYSQQLLQKQSEILLAIETQKIEQKKKLREADKAVVVETVKAQQDQEVAVTKAKENLAVAKLRLEAAKDEAAATLSKGKAAASVIQFENSAKAAGWNKSIQAFGGDGNAFAHYTLLEKLAPSYRQIMTNTSNSPLMDIFKSFNEKTTTPAQPQK